jgi:3-dehydroquinate synthase
VFKVQSHDHDYTVEFKSLDVADIQALGDYFIVDSHVLDHVGNLPNAIVVDANEELKSYAQAACIIELLIDKGLKRNHTLVAVGGGIVQDLTCWIASTYMRGIDWNFVPTTLLAQTDSCIGSKSSINFLGYKNLLGTFNAPQKVLICPEFLTTLNQADIRSGKAELIKLLIIGNFDVQHIEKVIHADNNALADYIKTALEVKRNFIQADEFDTGVRNILNYGHCFGHALESASDYRIPHGIAVAMGMDLANKLNDALTFNRYHHILKDLYADFLPLNIDTDRAIRAMNQDKKNTTGMANIIVPGPDGLFKNKYNTTTEFWNQCKELIESL